MAWYRRLHDTAQRRLKAVSGGREGPAYRSDARKVFKILTDGSVKICFGDTLDLSGQVYLGRSRPIALNFSVILTQNSNQLFRLRRYNGKWQEYLIPIENGKSSCRAIS